MKITKTKLAATTFGAALTSLYSAPELNAQIIELTTFSPDTVAFNNVPLSQSTQAVRVVLDQAIPVFNTFNGGTFVSDPIDVTVANALDAGGFSLGKSFAGGFLSEFGSVQVGDTLTDDFFDGDDFNDVPVLAFSQSATGTRYIAFVANGTTGYFSVDLGGFEGDIEFTGGEFTTTGDTIVVGPETAPVPEPSSVGLAALALGAVGLRRRRKKAATAA